MSADALPGKRATVIRLCMPAFAGLCCVSYVHRPGPGNSVFGTLFVDLQSHCLLTAPRLIVLSFTLATSFWFFSFVPVGGASFVLDLSHAPS